MPDIYFDVDTAISECPANIMPLLDDTDFKTRETAIAYNAAGMDLVWNFVTSAGAFTQTAVTPTTSGNYDWTHQGDGMYTIEIPASGGASINNDTEGYGWFTGLVTGVLPWRGPVIGFRAAALNDALCDGGDNLDVNTVQWLGTACATPTVAGVPEVDITHIGGDAQSGTDLKDFADAGYDPATNKVQGVVLVDTLTTYTGDTPQTGDSFARIGATGSGLTSLATQASVDAVDNFIDTEIADIQARLPAALVGGRMDSSVGAMAANTITAAAAAADFGAEIADAVWDEATAGHAAAGSTGLALTDILADTTEIGAAGAGLTNINLPDQTMNIVGNITGNLSGSVGSVTAGVSVAAGGIASTAFAAGAIDAASLAADAGAELADAFLDRNMATGTDSGTNSTAVRTPRQALRALRNKITLAGGVATITKEDDATTSWTTAIGTTAGDPVSSSDPT